jgi:hypothetical protein
MTLRSRPPTTENLTRSSQSSSWKEATLENERIGSWAATKLVVAEHGTTNLVLLVSRAQMVPELVVQLTCRAVLVAGRCAQAPAVYTKSENDAVAPASRQVVSSAT